MGKELKTFDTIIIGASAAGLATAVCLQRKSQSYCLLEAASHVGVAWRNHYDRLHLHTPRKSSGLPHFPMPKKYAKYPDRESVVEYLEMYCAYHRIEPRFDQRVTRVQQNENGVWDVETEHQHFEAKNVVIATGYTRVAVLPSWHGMGKYSGELMHSATYKNGSSWQGDDVLVVGFGNSACEIAIDLHEHGARPHMAVRSAVNIVPRDFLGIPILGFGAKLSALPTKLADFFGAPMVAATIGDVRKLGLRKLPYGPTTQIVKHGRIPLLDIGTVKLIREKKIQIHPGVKSFSPSGVTFTDGKPHDFKAVVLATGYHPALAEFLESWREVTSAEGIPLVSGKQSSLTGLYFCGFYVSPRGMLYEIGIEAEQIAKEIQANLS